VMGEVSCAMSGASVELKVDWEVVRGPWMDVLMGSVADENG